VFILSTNYTFTRQCESIANQWEIDKFDPQPTLNPWTDRHQIWNKWLRRGYLLRKIGLNPPMAIHHMYTKYTLKTLKCLLYFFVFPERL